MAADLTMIALPNTLELREMAEYRVGLRFFPDDEVHQMPWGPVWVAGDQRKAMDERLEAAIYDIGDTMDLGPRGGESRAEHIAQLGELWLLPKVITPQLVAKTTLLYNLSAPDYYRYWTTREPRGYWASKAGRKAYAHSRYRRVPRPRDVKKWMLQHEGKLAWTEMW